MVQVGVEAIAEAARTECAQAVEGEAEESGGQVIRIIEMPHILAGQNLVRKMT
jgi:hypothetical protein